MKRIFNTLTAIVLLLILTWCACKRDNGPQALKTGAVPGVVTKYSYVAIPGGAIITYDLPSGEDLRYIKATYTINTGEVRESKSAIYKNTVQVDGFADAGEYDVKLTSVGVGEVESTPVVIHIKTLRPAHKLVMDTIKINQGMYAAFGGINIDYSNPSAISLVFHVLAKDASTGKWQEIQTAYSSTTKGRVRIRGLASVSAVFGVFITDRWNNRTDTLTATLTPFQESLIDRTKFLPVYLPTDTYDPHTGQGRAKALPVLWDGAHTQSGSIFQTKPTTLIPQWFTLDMGAQYRLSRMIVYPDIPPSELNVYTGGQPSSFEMWGSNNPPADGSFNNWTLVSTFNSVKPSGLPLGQVSADDIALARNGEEFEFEGNFGKFRYWRFKTTATWGLVSYVVLNELTFYGTN